MTSDRKAREKASSVNVAVCWVGPLAVKHGVLCSSTIREHTEWGGRVGGSGGGTGWVSGCVGAWVCRLHTFAGRALNPYWHGLDAVPLMRP